jgi:hypothetical protein
MGHPHYTKEEIARRGKEWYEKSIRAKMTPENKGKVLVINVDTGDYELDQDHLAASRRAHAKDPAAPYFAMRVGYRAYGTMGGSMTSLEEQ